ncbi:MAG: Lrp/AsnC family transcriptional regulator [Candidatus Pedobacter colombiensis]|uniref:Lrp/AsnC family transcriptional regulator n=1 Tax=Candidatus Pedobacter colombiensis TaxID=3121371 RepID=A0AAJ5WAW7_9SPHI|nr:Lrp/AsnC family transcriptional regulator [Pedobacter sp.]WEK20975.1 MAG: Lrp/AsnC family transcriptional regulator [Pedobacter sp.]
MPFNLDELDLKLLFHLQQNARISVQEISRKIHLSPSAVSARIRRLEDKGYIKQYVTILNKSMVDRKLMSFTGVRLNHNSNTNLESFKEFVKRIPEVINCYHVNGMFDFLLHILATDMQDYRNCLVNTLAKFESVSELITFFVLDEVGVGQVIDLTHLLIRFNRNQTGMN